MSLLGGGGHIRQLLIGPLLAGFPIRIDMRAKRMSVIDLLPGPFGLLGSEEPRAGFASHGTGQAEVGAVARLEVLPTGAAGLAAP